MVASSVSPALKALDLDNKLSGDCVSDKNAGTTPEPVGTGGGILPDHLRKS